LKSDFETILQHDHHVETTCRAQHLGPYLEGQCHSATLQQNRVRPITLLFKVGFRTYLTEMITILRRRVARKFELLHWRSRSQHDLAAKSCPSNNFVIWSRISKIFYRNDHHIEMPCRAQIWVATLKVKVTAWPCRKSCPAQNFVIWSRISKIFHRNDHHIETTCHAQYLGRYLEGKGHSMTFQQNRVLPKTLLFVVRFYNYFT